VRIGSSFDGGNIEVLACEEPGDIRLAIRPDGAADFFQWFSFRLTGAAGQDCRLVIDNAGKASYPAGWEGYKAVASYDRETWFRIDTAYEDGRLIMRHRPAASLIHFAYFAPYSLERHADLIAHLQRSPRVQVGSLGATLDGRDLDLLCIGEAGDDRKACWLVARQHPGETMAEWWMEGFLGRLTDPDDALARAILEKAVVYAVPNMNPDGSFRGHLRSNAAGANLNREWAEPSLERSPEVFLVRRKMGETGVDFCLDVHGDEARPHNFLIGTGGIPGWSEALAACLSTFRTAYTAACPDYDPKNDLPSPAAGAANMTLCSNQVAETHGCLAMILEMPFKDEADRPNAATGWSPERSRKLGAAALDALYAVVDDLP